MTFDPYTADPELDLVLEREIDVPPELVWKAWTTPELVTRWFTPKPWETPECEIDLRPGGAFRTVMRSPEGEQHDNTGCYLELLPNEKLSWTSALAPGFRPADLEDDDLPLTAIIELRPNASGGTLYRAIAIHRDPEARKRHEEMGYEDGWGTALKQLVEVVKSL